MEYNGTFDDLTNTSINSILYLGPNTCKDGDNVSKIVAGGLDGNLTAAIEFFQAIFTASVNALTIVAVLKTAGLRSIANMYVISLAISDMLTGILMFYEFVLRLPGLRRHLDEHYFVCASVFVSVYITICESMLCVVLISFERFMYICYPFKYEILFTPASAKKSIAVTWIISSCFGLFPFFLNVEHKFKGCFYGVVSKKFYFYGTGLSFYISMALCLFLNISILRVAVRHRSRMNTTVFVASSSVAVKTPILSHMKMIKTFLIINIVFYLCWLPWITCSILRKFVCINDTLLDLFGIFGMSSGGVNFIVYALLNDDFRKAFKKLVCCFRSNRLEDSSGTDNNAHIGLSQLTKKYLRK
ncbi:hypothetical protein SNE40_018904 [Patella caerulea]|uniref:G-protein coupled receptors family 1 profile domain-containing protein n=1 Tax=Patella caerulea TaxID=87958 RepID=A0AAN8J673_PATCE